MELFDCLTVCKQKNVLMLNTIVWNQVKAFNCVQKNELIFKNVIFKMCLEIIYLIYMYKEDLALNNLQWLICQ